MWVRLDMFWKFDDEIFRNRAKIAVFSKRIILKIRKKNVGRLRYLDGVFSAENESALDFVLRYTARPLRAVNVSDSFFAKT